LWPPKCCFSAGNRWQSLGDKLPFHKRILSGFFSYEDLRHVNLWLTES
jgi:hypothetical protein